MSGTIKRGQFYRKALGPEGYDKMVEKRRLIHHKLLRRARLPLHHADMLPEFLHSSVAMPSRSQAYYREIEINHPHDPISFAHMERPRNLKHLDAEEQRTFKHLDRERPPTPPDVGPCDRVIAMVREEPPAFVHVPQAKETINLAPRPPAQPGTFVPAERHDESKGCEEYYNYVGNYRKGRLHGRGTYTFALGGTCTGEWKDNRQNGRALATYTNGCSYEGEWKDGFQHGHGVMRYPTGSVYEGDFREGVRCGDGKLTYSSGAYYEGQWEKNRQHGRGTHTNPWGSMYIGCWDNGFIKGRGQLLLNKKRVVRHDWPRMSFIEAVQWVRNQRLKAERKAKRRHQHLFGVYEAIQRAEEVDAIRDEIEAERLEEKQAAEAERRRMLKQKRAKNKKRAVAAVEAGIDPRG